MIGKRVRDALYVHRDACAALPEDLSDRLRAATDRAASDDWNVARIEPTVVGLLLYSDFDGDPFPILWASTRVDLISHSVRTRDFSKSRNPLILHRKELLVEAFHPQAALWRELTAALETRDLFRDSHLIGRRNAWAVRLAEAGVRVEAHRLCQT